MLLFIIINEVFDVFLFFFGFFLFNFVEDTLMFLPLSNVS